MNTKELTRSKMTARKRTTIIRKLGGEKQAEGVAYHEAAHAVFSMEYGFGTESLEIGVAKGRKGVHITPFAAMLSLSEKVIGDMDLEVAVNWVVQLLAGGHAKRMRLGEKCKDDGSGRDWWYNSPGCDWDTARNIAKHVCGCEEEVEYFLNWCSLRTKNLLRDPAYWMKVRTIAVRLHERISLDSRDIDTLLSACYANLDEHLKCAECDLQAIADRDAKKRYRPKESPATAKPKRAKCTLSVCR